MMLTAKSSFGIVRYGQYRILMSRGSYHPLPAINNCYMSLSVRYTELCGIEVNNRFVSFYAIGLILIRLRRSDE